MEKTTITVNRDTHKELMLYKIKSNAKNLDEVIKVVIEKLKEEQNEGQQNPSEPLY